MPEHIRALVAILALTSLVFAFAKKPFCAVAIAREDFARRRNLWFGITLIAFLAHNFWVYIVAVGVLVWHARAREHNPPALYFALLFAVPPIDAAIGGLGIVNNLFSIDYLRLLALILLMPTWWTLRRRADVPRFGFMVTDKFVIAYVVLLFLLRFPVDTTTNALRNGFQMFTDIFLPYYVCSRALRDLDQFRDALAAFVLAGLLLAVLGLFEAGRHWLLYASLAEALGIDWDYAAYLGRGAALRSMASTGFPIVHGYIMVVALGFFGFLSRSIPNRWRNPGLLVLVVGLLASVSRGPWVGAALLPLLFALTGERPLRKLAFVGLATCVVAGALVILPFGGALIEYLPFIGTVEAENVTYRQKLVDNALIVIGQNPLFGSFDALNTPEMEEMRQGQGIIDIVNTYLAIALSYGLIGVAMFAGIFISSIASIWKAMLSFRKSNDDSSFRLGQALLVTQVATLVVIATVSSILAVPIIYWSLAGLGVAYARLLNGAESRAIGVTMISTTHHPSRS
jgi:O-antigen ligase